MSSQRSFFAGFIVLLTTGSVLAAIGAKPFGVRGTGGEVNGQTLTFGSRGLVYELDAFLHIGDLDLNGAAPGTSARFSRHAVPAGLTLSVTTNQSPDGSDLWITYVLSNSSATVFEDVRFFSFLDAEIDEKTNTFFNEYGVVSGAAGLGSRDPDPDFWEIDEPGFVDGTIIDQLILGVLNSSNCIPAEAADDVAFGLGFALGDLETNATTHVLLMLSDDGSHTGSVALVHRDTDTNSADVLTLSGIAFVPESQYEFNQTTGDLQLAFNWELSRQTGTFFGTLTIANPAGSNRHFAEPYQLAMLDPSGTYTTNRFMMASGKLPNGDSYLDITGDVLDSLTSQAFGSTLDPGESVVVTGIEVYDRFRRTPLDALFVLWANGN